MTSETKMAWAEVGNALEALSLSLKLHYEERAGTGVPKTPREVAAIVNGAIAAIGDAVDDQAVREQTTRVAETLEQALCETAQAIPANGRHSHGPGPYIGEVAEGEDFRRVLFTGEHSQLVVMTLLPGQDIGAETHQHDQIILLLKGQGECEADGIARRFTGHTALCVPAGTRHNVHNTGDEPMRLATVYAPPEHPAGTVHHTKADAQVA
jgi:mannose-6-phosphate isomerase-like protein (cupin superfamily)